MTLLLSSVTILVSAHKLRDKLGGVLRSARLGCSCPW